MRKPESDGTRSITPSADAFRTLFESSPQGLQIYRAESLEDPGELRLLAQNAAVSKLVGVDVGDNVGKTIRETAPQYLESEFPSRYLAAIVSGKPDHWVVTYHDEHFPRAVWRASLVPLDAEHVAVVFENITAQHDAEEQVRKRTNEVERANLKLEALAARVTANLDESEARFRAVLDQVPGIVWTADRDLVIQSSRGSALSTLGLETDEVVGLTLQQFLGTEDPEDPAVRAHVEALGGSPRDYGYEIGGRAYDVKVKPLTSPDDSIAGVIGVALDVTEYRALQESLLRKQRLESVGRLAGGIAHDFNNLLTIILNQAHFLKAPSPDAVNAAHDAEPIIEAAEHGARLTSQLLAFARQQVTRPVHIQLNEHIEKMSTMWDRVLGDDIEVVLELDGSLGTVRADPGQIEQVLMNLTLNARDAMPTGGRLRIGTATVNLPQGNAFDVAPGRYVKLVVEDDGAGMEADVVSRAFEPFFTTKKNEGGTGLGLSTVYGVIEQSGGAIRIDSAVGRGTCFEIVIPVSLVAAGSAAAEKNPGVSSSSGGTILVTDDNLAVRRVTVRGLQRAGYVVLEAGGGEEALSVVAQTGPIDLAVLDVVMPGMTGPELAAKLREKSPKLPVVYISGYPGGSLEHESDAHFLAKPFSPVALLELVESAIRGKEPS